MFILCVVALLGISHYNNTMEVNFNGAYVGFFESTSGFLSQFSLKLWVCV